jgi:regulator of replication initiation timing
MRPDGSYFGSTMSYLENGSTLRAMFRLMPPMRHDIDPSRSEVLAYIMDNLRCDLGKSIRSFNSMRNIKSGVLIYDRIHRQWRGCDWVPAEEVDKVSMLLAMITEMKRDISSLRSEDRKLRHMISTMRRRKGSRDVADSDVEAQEQKSSPDVDPKELERKKREEEDAAYDKSSKEFWGAILAEMNDEPVASAASTRPRSSPSDSTAPTQSHLENAEDVVS